MDMEVQEKTNVIRPLNNTETAQFIRDYKELFLNSIKDYPKADSDKLIERINNLTHVQNKIDPNCILELNRRLVRIEYPGEVKNVSKALDTLGGLYNVEASVADHNKKLEIRFHPQNRYNKPAVADKDFKPGILLKVKKSMLPSTTEYSDDDEKFSYEVVGVSVMNFSFNRLCDFQYLPLVTEIPETKESKAESIYEKIVPKELPTFEWLTESQNMEPFLLPVCFSLHDNSFGKLNVDSQDKTDTKTKKSEIQNNPMKMTSKQQKSIRKIFGRTRLQISIFVNSKDPEVPTKPLDATLKALENKGLQEKVERVKQLFKERPIWTKAAIRYNTGLTAQKAKIVVSAVAYYFTNGPWRSSWVRYGYDPRTDPKARIYQTLDYRIRTADNAQLKVKPKRNYASKTTLLLGPHSAKRVSLKDDISTRPRLELDERCYVLRPLTIPPARQMFYQLCDLLLPEVQEMISKLPNHTGGVCDPKNGWLPKNFIETCRDKVNEYVLEAVQRELVEDQKVMQERQKEDVSKKKEPTLGLDYCNQMLSNIKRGIYQTVQLKQPVAGGSQQRDVDVNDSKLINLIDISSDEDDEYTVGDIIKCSIPEKMTYDDDHVEDEDDDNLSHISDDAEIDYEVVQEINELISESKKFNI